MTDDQMTFEDVVDMEPQAGDPEYTDWIAAGRPKLSVAEYTALRQRYNRASVEDVLPGL